ncbi:MAG: hypothetical protein ACOY0R_02635 [Chloroflexota bacterium]
MKHLHKILSIFVLLALVSLVFATPARAFDGRAGQDVTIGADEVIEDDLYVSAENFTLKGTVMGDLIVVGALITIDGSVEGDLIAAGQAIVINGTVTDDVRMAGAAMQVNDGAVIGDDMVAAGASIEVKAGSTIGGEAVVAGAQAVLSGEVAGDVLAATAALELNGAFGGDVDAYVDATDKDGEAMPMNLYMTDMPIAIPSVKMGLAVDDHATIAGDLHYTSTVELEIPAVVGGKVTRTDPPVEPADPTMPVELTAGQKAMNWGFDILRWMVTLIVLSLLLGWLFPKFMKAVPQGLWDKPWPSLGWGLVAFSSVGFVGLLLFIVWIIGIILSSTLTLGWLTATIVMVGLLAQFGLAFGFILVTFLLTQILVSENIGKWLLSRVKPELADHKYWPSILGIVVLVLGLSLFSFPLIPLLGGFGFLMKVVVVLFGFGALWLWGRAAWQARATA